MKVVQSLPLDASEIFVEWMTVEGGIGVTACTDDKGDAYLGVYPLNRMGKPNGLPCRFRRRRLKTDIVIGYTLRSPVVIVVDVEVNAHGVSLVVSMPIELKNKYRHHVAAAWGSGPPTYAFMASPCNSNWSGVPFPTNNCIEL